MLPRISLHGIPEPHPEGLPHGSGGNSRTAEAPGRAGHGSIAPSSLTPGDFGLVTEPAGAGRNALRSPQHMGDPYRPVTFRGVQGSYYILGGDNPSWVSAGDAHVVYQRDPVTGGYVPTHLTAHHGAGGWVLNNPPPMQVAAAHPQPGSSRAASSQRVKGVKVPRLPKGPSREIVTGKSRAWIRLSDYPAVRTFEHGEKLLEGTPRGRPYSDREREYAAEQVTSYLTDAGYSVSPMHAHSTPWDLEAFNPETGLTVPVYVKMTTHGMTTPPQVPPPDQPYLIALVRIARWDGALQTLHIIPMKGEAKSDAPAM